MAVAAPVYVPTDTEVSVEHPVAFGHLSCSVASRQVHPPPDERSAPVLTARYSIVASWLVSKSLTSVVVCSRKYSGDS